MGGFIVLLGSAMILLAELTLTRIYDRSLLVRLPYGLSKLLPERRATGRVDT
jgi:hypothetical protein